MAKARNWEALKPATRRRYERAGVSRKDYLSGMSLKAARGHANTPEHPRRGPRPGQGQYWINKIVPIFQNRHKYRGPHKIGDDHGTVDPTPEDIQIALEFFDDEDEEELAELASRAAKGILPEWNWLWYH